jgi:hypothetical protein
MNPSPNKNAAPKEAAHISSNLFHYATPVTLNETLFVENVDPIPIVGISRSHSFRASAIQV